MSRRYGGYTMSELVEQLPPRLAADLQQLEDDWYDIGLDTEGEDEPLTCTCCDRPLVCAGCRQQYVDCRCDPIYADLEDHGPDGEDTADLDPLTRTLLGLPSGIRCGTVTYRGGMTAATDRPG